MLRDKSLIPLSRQHQHALALCVRIDRASPIPEADLGPWQAEIAQQFQTEVKIHFDVEELTLFPAARKFPELTSLVEDLLADHAFLRDQFALAESGKMSAIDLNAFGQRLSAHIRKEERQLFERLQQLLDSHELSLLGKQIAEALAEIDQTCILPDETTKLRSTK